LIIFTIVDEQFKDGILVNVIDYYTRLRQVSALMLQQTNQIIELRINIIVELYGGYIRGVRRFCL
jgi:hypothetical protein